MNKKLKVCSIQMESRPGDAEYNLQQAYKLIAEAKKNDVKLVLLPELFDVGYDLDLVEKMEYSTDKTLDKLKETCSSQGIYIIAGIYEKSEEGRFNTAYVINPDGCIVGKYRKNKLFCLSKEREVFKKGQELEVVEIEGIKFGLMICYDIRFPEIGRAYVDKGCEALAVISAFPFPRVEHWKTLLRARAIENQMYVVAANRVGREAGFWFHGKSCIIDAWGTIVQEANETDQCIIAGEIESEKVQEVRKKLPALLDK